MADAHLVKFDGSTVGVVAGMAGHHQSRHCAFAVGQNGLAAGGAVVGVHVG